ncbi:MAG: hypothetical protein SGARI_006519, partial [Bacillariaceae sp.]
MIRKCLLVLLVAVATLSGNANAFTKPSSSAIAAAANQKTVSSLDVVADLRGGAAAKKKKKSSSGGSILDVSKSDVVKTHGMACLFFAAVFLAETFGIEIPVVGPTALLPGFHAGGGKSALVYVTRFLGGVMAGLGLAEMEFCGSAAMQDIFTKYHVVTAALLILTTHAMGGEGMAWLYAALVSLFAIA